jgi:BASS family bile acid:Na+ symporter
VKKAGGSESYAIGLLVASSVLALFTIPLGFVILREAFGLTLRVPITAISKLLSITVLLPLAAGIVVRLKAPRHAEAWIQPISLAAIWLLVLALLPPLLKIVPELPRLVGDGTLAVLAAFVVVGLVAGFFLGGQASEDRTVLALAAASRHPGIALALVHLNYPEQRLAPVAIVLYMLVNVVVSLPYQKWSQRHAPRAASRPALASR